MMNKIIYKAVNIINTLLRKLEIIIAVCVLVSAFGRIFKNELINKFLDFFVILPVILLMIWFVCASFLGTREIIILPPKIKKQLKDVNFSNSEKDKYKLVFVFVTLLYAIIMYSNYKGNIFIGGYPDAERHVYIAATVVYALCCLYTLNATNTVMPNVELILEKNLGLKKVGTGLYCKELLFAGISYYFRYYTSEKLITPFPYVDRRRTRTWRYRRRKIKISYSTLSSEVIFPESVESAIQQNIDKISEIYKFLIIEIDKRENEIIVRMKNRTAYYTESTSAKYIITLLISMVNVAEQIIL